MLSCRRTKPTLGPPPALPEQRRAARFVPLPEWYWEPVEPDVHARAEGDRAPGRRGLARARRRRDARVGRARRRGARASPARRPRRPRGRGCTGGACRHAPANGCILHGCAAAARPVRRHARPRSPTRCTSPSSARSRRSTTRSSPPSSIPCSRSWTRVSPQSRRAPASRSAEALQLARAIVAVAHGLASERRLRLLLAPSELGPGSRRRSRASSRTLAARRARCSAFPSTTARFVVPARCREARLVSCARVARVGAARAGRAQRGPRRRDRCRGLTPPCPRRDAPRARHGPRRRPGIHASWSRISRLLSFVWGPSDDPRRRELDELASAIGVHLEDPKHVANVVTVDWLRHRAARGRRRSSSTAPARPAPRACRCACSEVTRLPTRSRSRRSRRRTRRDAIDASISPCGSRLRRRGPRFTRGRRRFAGYDDVLARAIARARRTTHPRAMRRSTARCSTS